MHCLFRVKCSGFCSQLRLQCCSILPFALQERSGRWASGLAPIKASDQPQVRQPTTPTAVLVSHFAAANPPKSTNKAHQLLCTELTAPGPLGHQPVGPQSAAGQQQASSRRSGIGPKPTRQVLPRYVQHRHSMILSRLPQPGTLAPWHPSLRHTPPLRPTLVA